MLQTLVEFLFLFTDEKLPVLVNHVYGLTDPQRAISLRVDPK